MVGWLCCECMDIHSMEMKQPPLSADEVRLSQDDGTAGQEEKERRTQKNQKEFQCIP